MPGRIFKSEMIPTEAIAIIIYRLARFGVLRTDDAAQRAERTLRAADRVLNKACRVIPITKRERGVWVVQDSVTEAQESLRPLLRALERDLEATPVGVAFCASVKRRDMVQLVRGLKVLLGEGD